MDVVKFRACNREFGKHQPEYITMPAHQDHEGRVTTCYALSWRERLRVLLRGQIWLQLLTFNQPVQPQKLLLERPELMPEVW